MSQEIIKNLGDTYLNAPRIAVSKTPFLAMNPEDLNSPIFIKGGDDHPISLNQIQYQADLDRKVASGWVTIKGVELLVYIGLNQSIVF